MFAMKFAQHSTNRSGCKGSLTLNYIKPRKTADPNLLAKFLQDWCDSKKIAVSIQHDFNDGPDAFQLTVEIKSFNLKISKFGKGIFEVLEDLAKSTINQLIK